MIINKNKLNEVHKILRSFSYVPKNSLLESKKVSLPDYIVAYLENKENGNIKLSPVYETSYAKYYVEYYNNSFMFVREIKDEDRETRLVLSVDDLPLIKDIQNITLKDVKALVKKIEKEEKRFGL